MTNPYLNEQYLTLADQALDEGKLVIGWIYDDLGATAVAAVPDVVMEAGRAKYEVGPPPPAPVVIRDDGRAVWFYRVPDDVL